MSRIWDLSLGKYALPLFVLCLKLRLSVYCSKEKEDSYRLGPCLMINCIKFVAVKAPVDGCCWWMSAFTSLKRGSMDKLKRKIVMLFTLGGWEYRWSE